MLKNYYLALPSGQRIRSPEEGGCKSLLNIQKKKKPKTKHYSNHNPLHLVNI